MVNTVLCSKAGQMQALEIRFACNARIPAILPMADLELCALLANSLDNAIEACEKLPKAQKEITLDAAMELGVFAMEVRNPCPKPPKTAGGRIVSGKSDSLRHGFGLPGMKEIADRYGGALEYGYQDGGFRLFFSVLLDC